MKKQSVAGAPTTVRPAAIRLTERVPVSKSRTASSRLRGDAQISPIAPGEATIETERFTVSAGANLYAALDLPNADEREAKASTAIRIGDTIELLGLTPNQAAKLIGITATDVSNIIRGKTGGYPIECLVEVLDILSQFADQPVGVPGR